MTWSPELAYQRKLARTNLLRLAFGGALLGIAIALDGDAVLVALGALAAIGGVR